MSEGDVAVELEKPRRSRGGGWLNRDWLFALSLAFATGVAVWFGRSIKEFFVPSAATVLVPALIGTAESDASAEADRLNLKLVVVARQPSDRFPQGVVMGQQPPAGSHVREGRQLAIIVSNGVNIFPMPDLRYMSLREARLNCSRRHLIIASTKVVPNDDVPANHVLSQDPVPLQSVREGSTVRLVLSKGPPESVTVPDFVNQSIDEARDLAAQRKIHLGQIVWTPFGLQGPPRGTIVRQSPPAGAHIDPFAPVSLQVSAGPHQYGYLVRQVHASVRVPIEDDSAQVRVEIRDETGVWNVYNGFAQGGQQLDFNLTVIGTAEMNTYVNNELLETTILGKEAPEPGPAAPHGAAKVAR